MPIQSASEIQMNYMGLLIEQLKHQNPLDPLDNKEMASQLAQFSQLQQLETLNGKFDELLYQVARSGSATEGLQNALYTTEVSKYLGYAVSLVGKTVTFRDNKLLADLKGVAEDVRIAEDGIFLKVGNVTGVDDEAWDVQEYTLGLDEINTVRN